MTLYRILSLLINSAVNSMYLQNMIHGSDEGKIAKKKKASGKSAKLYTFPPVYDAFSETCILLYFKLIRPRPLYSCNQELHNCIDHSLLAASALYIHLSLQN